MEEEKYKIPLFDGSNFSDWNYRVKLQLDEQDLLEHVVKPLSTLLEPFELLTEDSTVARKNKEEQKKKIVKSDKKCKSFVVQRIQDGLLEVIKDKETAYDLWKALSDRFESSTATTRMTLARELHSLTYKPRAETFQQYCLRFDKLIRGLRQAGDSIDEEGSIIRFLLSMPGEYESVISALQTLVSKDLTMDFVRVRIEEYETSKRSVAVSSPKFPSIAAAFLGHTKNDGFQFKCNNCGLRGHRKVQCYRPGGGAYRARGARGARGSYRGGRGYDRWSSSGSGSGSGSGSSSRGGARGRARDGSSWSRSGCGAAFRSTQEAGRTNAVNASCAVAEDTDPVAYCFMSPVTDNFTVTMDCSAQCLSQMQKEDIQKLNDKYANGDAWYLDSGASDHMVHSNMPVINKRKLNKPVSINVAKNSSLMFALEIEDIEAYTEVQGVPHKYVYQMF